MKFDLSYRSSRQTITGLFLISHYGRVMYMLRNIMKNKLVFEIVLF
ncbi:hypothetical protein BIW11_11918 [Tropilaelaps mercedesae]|uniref:Uncharacterized protein n=1 Tax=Tropilaelaps mercedesae TaxID=418985 RepID=A0A1V9X9B4_9ACAR|nr:hypothetical protein BIW11_11918 [Tropilaelaps mercedesae]